MTGSFSQSGSSCPYNTPPPPYPSTPQPPALHGYRLPPIDSSDQRNSSDLEQFSQGQRQMQGYPPRSVEGVPAEYVDTDLDVHQATDGHTSDSDVTGSGDGTPTYLLA